VKSRNVFNRESKEAVYEFTILPPWYRTWWAYVCYLLFSIGFVAGVVTLSTRGLKAIIRERTAEIVKQKEVIEYKNRNITDSINYAKRIQEAIYLRKNLCAAAFLKVLFCTGQKILLPEIFIGLLKKIKSSL